MDLNGYDKGKAEDSPRIGYCLALLSRRDRANLEFNVTVLLRRSRGFRALWSEYQR